MSSPVPGPVRRAEDFSELHLDIATNLSGSISTMENSTVGVATQTPRYIAVEGAIGVGKTTLAHALAERIGARLVLERFEDNPFLPDFYRDAERFAFQTQMFFLLSRYRQQQELAQLDLFHDHVVSDYLFDKDRIFASLTLSDTELALYESVHGALRANVPRPDLVVLLQSSVERLQSNIRLRGRPMESAIEDAYLQRLNAAYAQHFVHGRVAPTVVVNATELDFVERPDVLERILDTILSPSDDPIRMFGTP